MTTPPRDRRAAQPMSARLSAVMSITALVLPLSLSTGMPAADSPRVAASRAAAPPPATGAPEPDPGHPAPAAVVAELQAALAQARQRFEARDVPGVLSWVSDQYRTGPFTKPVVREQLNAIVSVYDEVKAPIRIDHVQMVGDQAWVYSTGEISGRLRLIGRWVVLYSWQRELEVARRESGRWRLFGYQQ
jgi:hypothetical protein